MQGVQLENGRIKAVKEATTTEIQKKDIEILPEFHPTVMVPSYMSRAFRIAAFRP